MSYDVGFEIKPANYVKYNEVYGPTALHYALLKKSGDKLEQLHYPFRCKDFFSDMFWIETTQPENKYNREIYGFGWEPGGIDTQQPTYLMGLQFPKVNLHDHQESLLAFLNEWERQLKLPLSSIYTANDDQIVVEFSGQWTRKPATFSLFTLLLRVGLSFKPMTDVFDHLKQLSQTGNPYGHDDHAYLSDMLAKGRLQAVWNKRRVIYGAQYNVYENIDQVHNQSGIYSTKEVE